DALPIYHRRQGEIASGCLHGAVNSLAHSLGAKVLVLAVDIRQVPDSPQRTDHIAMAKDEILHLTVPRHKTEIQREEAVAHLLCFLQRELQVVLLKSVAHEVPGPHS